MNNVKKNCRIDKEGHPQACALYTVQFVQYSVKRFKDPLEKYRRKRVGKLGGTGSYGKGGSRSSRCQNPISTLLANRHHQVSKNNLEYLSQDFEISKALCFKLQTDKIDLS